MIRYILVLISWNLVYCPQSVNKNKGVAKTAFLMNCRQQFFSPAMFVTVLRSCKETRVYKTPLHMVTPSGHVFLFYFLSNSNNALQIFSTWIHSRRAPKNVNFTCYSNFWQQVRTNQKFRQNTISAVIVVFQCKLVYENKSLLLHNTAKVQYSSLPSVDSIIICNIYNILSTEISYFLLFITIM